MNTIPIRIIKELILSGCKFLYESYDYNAAMLEFKNATNNHYISNIFSPYCIPDEIKQNHIVWRIGKIREIKFNNNCEIFKFKIGARYYKTFFLNDFGIKFKPIIFKSDDSFDLISKGFAVEDNI